MKKIILLLCFFTTLSSVFAVSYENLYVVGNACSAGWNPGGALTMTKESEGVFSWTGSLLKPVNDQERFKFLVSNGWNPSITCRFNVDGHLMTASGQEYDIFERAENASGPDNAFQVAEDGIYTIQVNLNTMKMTCTKTGNIEVEKPELSQLYLIGDACEAEWNFVKALEMTKVEEGVFIWVGELSTDNGSEFKFLNEKGTWDKTINPSNGDVTFVNGTEYSLGFRPTEGSPKDYKFKVTTSGKYYILANLNTMKITIDKATPDLGELFIVGDACQAGWNETAALTMLEVEEGIYTWTGDLSVNGEFKFLTKKGIWGKTINPLNSDIDFTINTEYNLNYRPLEASPYDFKFKVTTAGRYTIDVNLIDMTIIIETGGNVALGNGNINPVFYVNASNKTLNLHNKDNVFIKYAGVFDITGKCINLVSNIESSVTLAENLTSGIYIIRIHYDNKETTQKVVVN